MGDIKIFLAPCRNDNASAHFYDTVHDGIDRELYSQYTDKEYGDSVAIWGTNKGGERFWKQMSEGDVVLFYLEKGVYPFGAKIRDTEENRELARQIWHSYDTGITKEDEWPYVIYLKDPFALDIRSADLHDLAGWNIDYLINFTRLGEDAEKRISREFGSLRSYVRHHRSETPGVSEEEVEEAGEVLEQKKRTDPDLTGDKESFTTTRQRDRSAAFRRKVQTKYNESCAVCGARRESPTGNPEVEAAHIYPKSENGNDDIRNGLSLCKLHHWAFDVGWISLTDKYEILVKEIDDRAGYEEFSELEGSTIAVPEDESDRPHPVFLSAHREMHGFVE